MVIQNKVLGLLGLAAKAGKVVSGADIVKELIEKQKIKVVILAEDASEKTKKNIQFVCEKNKVPIFTYSTIDFLSKAIGKKNRAIVGIKDKNLSAEIAKQISGGDFIG